jgi:HlyD family secretion protein
LDPILRELAPDDVRAHRRRRGLFGWPLSVVIVGVLALVGLGLFASGGLSRARTGSLEGATVQRGPLLITVSAHGNLKAADSVSLKSEVEGRTLILSLVPEGRHVKAGDVVCELDATALVEKEFQQTIAVSNAEAALVKARQNYEIQASQNKSDIAQAKQKLEFAHEDLRKYMEGERASELEKSKEAIGLAEEDSTRAKDRLEWSKKLAQKGFLTTSELQADQLAHNRAQVTLQQAKRESDLLERFNVPRRESELRAADEEAQRERERVELQAKARIVDFEADVRTNEARFELENSKLARVRGQIEKARIKAPREGLLVYAQRDSDEPPIQEGTEVRERQEILTIPNTAGMIVQAKLHESVLKQVRIGQTCTIRVDAIPSQQFEGRVAFVALLPDQNSWWANPNLRVYRTDIEITSRSEEMRPGMSCAIEILIEELPDALFVPVQCVFRHKDDNVCFVAAKGAPQMRTVRVGRHNEQWVQILEGLKENETVLLFPPPDFGPTPAAATPDEEKPPAPPAAKPAEAAKRPS